MLELFSRLWGSGGFLFTFLGRSASLFARGWKRLIASAMNCSLRAKTENARREIATLWSAE
jgi:hypothetical protein